MNKEILLDAVSLIGEDLITEHFLKKNAAVRQKKRILRTIPIAAALMALAVIAVSLLPGMLNIKLSITTIPGAVKKDLPLLSDPFYDGTFGYYAGTFVPTEQFIENLKKSTIPLVIGSADNYETVFVEGGSYDFYITTFDLLITEVIKNFDDTEIGKIIKCANVIRVTKDGLLAPTVPVPDSEYRISPTESEKFVYQLLLTDAGNWRFRDNIGRWFNIINPNYDLSKYADYYVELRYPFENNYFYFVHGDKIYFDQINE